MFQQFAGNALTAIMRFKTRSTAQASPIHRITTTSVTLTATARRASWRASRNRDVMPTRCSCLNTRMVGQICVTVSVSREQQDIARLLHTVATRLTVAAKQVRFTCITLQATWWCITPYKCLALTDNSYRYLHQQAYLPKDARLLDVTCVIEVRCTALCRMIKT